MALSSSESALLSQTCENMNIAANTCREVLEMLRNLGNTGVVDIATHNNAADAHANVASLAHISDNEKMSIGPAGYCNSASTHQNDTIPAMRVIGAGGFYSIGGTTKGASAWVMSNNHGANSSAIYNCTLLESDSNGDIAVAVQNRYFGGIKNYYNYLNGQGNVENRQISFIGQYGGLQFSGGSPVDAGCGNWILSTANETTNNKLTYYFSGTCIAPLAGITASLGISQLPFDTAYLATAATVTSDRREKIGISSLDAKAVDFIKSLRPVQYTLKNGRQNVLEADEQGNATSIETIPGIRHHWGLVAQEVQEALSSAGYDPSDCAVWSLADKDDPDSKQALRYEELIAPMIKVIQQQQERIEALERKVA